jgi:hypothetical protein
MASKMWKNSNETLAMPSMQWILTMMLLPLVQYMQHLIGIIAEGNIDAHNHALTMPGHFLDSTELAGADAFGI